MCDPIRVSIVGVGNCASSLVQGVHYYHQRRSGLIHWQIGNYEPSAIQFSAAFDVDREKVGKRLDQAIFAGRNNSLRFADVPHSDVTVLAAPALDGIGPRYREAITTVEGLAAKDVVQALRDAKTDLILNYLPVGSAIATRWWAERALEAQCAFVNCIPEFIASVPEWQHRFREARLPLVGDDVKSQVGATIIHRVLAHLFAARGAAVERTYQLNFGGNMDFYNMLDGDRLHSKRQSKQRAVEAELPSGTKPSQIHISPSGYVEWLGDKKCCYIRMEGTAFGGSPINLEVRLEVHDSPNSAGVVIDVIRFVKLGLDRKIYGPLLPVCAAYMKSPPQQVPDEDASEQLAQWLNETSRGTAEGPSAGSMRDTRGEVDEGPTPRSHCPDK